MRRTMREVPRTRGRTQAAAALLALCACGPTRNPETDDVLPPQVSLSGVRLHAWEGNVLAARGTADQLTYDRASGSFEATNARVAFPPRPGPAAARESPLLRDLELVAPRAKGTLAPRRVEASGGVEVKTGEGLEARTESARFDGEGLVAHGDQPIEVRGTGYALDAARFTFYLLTEELIFEGGVRSRLGVGEPR